MTPTRALIEAAEEAKQILNDIGNSNYADNINDAMNILAAAISSAKAAEEGVETNKAPEHAFELRITVGANEADYVAEALTEIRDTINRSGIAGACSGGWDGSWSIDVSKRDVTPDQYRDELEQWRTVIEVREKEGL